jgi:hypothetical protein
LQQFTANDFFDDSQSAKIVEALKNGGYPPALFCFDSVRLRAQMLNHFLYLCRFPEFNVAPFV